MKKVYSFMLMATALLFSANLNATVHEVGTFDQLRTAIDNAENGDEIQLTANITFNTVTYEQRLNVTKSITIDGKNHVLTGACQRQAGKSIYATIWLNIGGTEMIDVVIKNLTTSNPRTDAAWQDKGIETRGNINSLTLENVSITAPHTALQIGGSQVSAAEVNLTNCILRCDAYYCIVSYNPYIGTINNTTFNGWNALYFKGADGSTGSRGSEVTLTNCTLNNKNMNSGKTNTFGAIVFEDADIDVTVDNCQVDARGTDGSGVAKQYLFLLSDWADLTDAKNVNLVIKGEDTNIQGQIIGVDPSEWDTPEELKLDIQGGTCDAVYYYEAINSVYLNVTVGAGKTAIYVADGDGKFRFKTTLTENKTLNDDVEHNGKGQNPNTSFRVNANQTISSEVVADYALVEDGAELVVEDKLTLNNMDVTGDSKVIVKAGATLVIGEGGVMAETANNIIVETEDGNPGVVLIDPDVKSNTTPKATVQFTSKAYKDGDNRVYQFFGSPMKSVESFTTTSTTAKTWLDIWNVNKFDYFGSINDDKAIDYSQFSKPFAFICMSSDNAADALQTYTMTGNLYGIEEPSVKVYAEWSGMANAYMGEIDITALENANQAAINNGSTVNLAIYTYVQQGNRLQWNANNPLSHSIEKIAPMQPFMFENENGNVETRTLSYEDLVWTPATTTSPAPARRQVAADMTKATLRVEAADGLYDMLTVAESQDFSAGKDLYDAKKYMNSDLNFYVTDSEKMNILATDNLDNTYLGFACTEAGTYTISFNNIEGNTLTLVDLNNGKHTDLTDGGKYTFNAAANESNDYRFKLVNRREVVTDVENIEKAAVRAGVYTLTGQYMGEMNIWNTLPAGIYVVDGVKRVK